MRTSKFLAAMTAVLTVVSGTPAFAQSAAEIDLLKAQLAELQQRLALLEEKQKAQEQVAATSAKTATDAQATADRTADVLAQTRASLSFSGDARYRHETLDVEYVDSDRTRQRIRARVGMDFRVNDTVKGTIRLATGVDDPRSANATLTGSNSRKDFGLDQAYLEWSPISNPTSGISADSILLAGQVGWRGDVADGYGLTVSATYLDFGAVEGYNPFYAGNAFGNTTTSSAAVCRKTISNCLLSDFNVVLLSGELATTVAGRPLRAFADLAQNVAAETNPVANKKLDSAYALGFTYGKASAARSWEFGALYQDVQKDALFGQFIDSNFGDGNTDADGFVFSGAYAPSRNWTISGRFFLNSLNNDVPTSVTLLTPTATNPTATAARSVSERDYKRLQVDLNFKF
ncbi:MAG: putative porin [Proteobacteria bacterium]|nr:putative porin [Pseudomonadota bacterium]